MKTNITVSIDTEVASELKKQKNASGMINAYLRAYYGITPAPEIIKAEVEEEIKEAGLE